jgi:hypothetical protein
MSELKSQQYFTIQHNLINSRVIVETVLGVHRNSVLVFACVHISPFLSFYVGPDKRKPRFLKFNKKD